MQTKLHEKLLEASRKLNCYTYDASCFMFKKSECLCSSSECKSSNKCLLKLDGFLRSNNLSFKLHFNDNISIRSY